jgi:hypothetical protein
MKKTRQPTIQEIKTKKMQTDLLTAQQLAANLYEQNATKDQAIKDLQQTVAALYEGSVK